jgi:DNA uptake protein ComE-like DNA-binding protein
MTMRRIAKAAACMLALGWAAAPQPRAAETQAKPGAPAVLLDALYPDGIPSETPKTETKPTTATRSADRATSGSAAGDAGEQTVDTLVIRRTRRATAQTTTTATTRSLTRARDHATTATTGTLRARRGSGATTGTSATLRAQSGPAVRLDEIDSTATLITSGSAQRAAAAVHLPPVGAPPNPDGVWINSAPALELERKLRLDARRARMIVEYRTTYGPFTTPDDLSQVTGITDDMVRRWESSDLIFF